MCYFDKTGKMLTGWQTINNKKYYLGKKSGVRFTGLKKVDGSYYVFTEFGVMQSGKNAEVNGVTYTLDATGKIVNVPVPKKTTITKTKATKNSVTLTWDNKKNDGYAIYMATSKDGEYTKVLMVKGKTISKTIKDLKKNKTYYFKIKSYKKIGDYKVYSKSSKIVSVKTKKK